MTQCFGMQSAVIDDEGDLFLSGKIVEATLDFLLFENHAAAGRDEVVIGE